MKKLLILFLILALATPAVAQYDGLWRKWVYFDNDTVWFNGRGYPIKILSAGGSVLALDSLKSPVILVDTLSEYTSGNGIHILSNLTTYANVTMSQQASETFMVVSDDGDTLEFTPKADLYVFRYSDGGTELVTIDSMGGIAQTVTHATAQTVNYLRSSLTAISGTHNTWRVRAMNQATGPSTTDMRSVYGQAITSASLYGGTGTGVFGNFIAKNLSTTVTGRGGFFEAETEATPTALTNLYGVYIRTKMHLDPSSDAYGLMIDNEKMATGFLTDAYLGMKSTTWASAPADYGIDMNGVYSFNTADIRLSNSDIISGAGDSYITGGDFGIGGQPQAMFHVNPERDSGGDQDEDSSFVVTDRGWVMIGGIDPDALLEIESQDHGIIHLDAAANAIFEFDRGSTSDRSELRFQTANAEQWRIGLPDSNIAGDGSEFFIGQIVGGANADFWVETNGNIGLSNTDPDDFITAVHATPVFTLTDSDINTKTSTSSEQQDSAAIVLDASQTNPQFKWRGTDGAADAWELTGNTDDAMVFQNATTYDFDATLVQDITTTADAYYTPISSIWTAGQDMTSGGSNGIYGWAKVNEDVENAYSLRGRMDMRNATGNLAVNQLHSVDALINLDDGDMVVTDNVSVFGAAVHSVDITAGAITAAGATGGTLNLFYGAWGPSMTENFAVPTNGMQIVSHAETHLDYGVSITNSGYMIAGIHLDNHASNSPSTMGAGILMTSAASKITYGIDMNPAGIITADIRGHEGEIIFNDPDGTWDFGAAAVVFGGGLTITGNIVPSSGATYDLGSYTADWDSLFVDDVDVDVNLAVGGVARVGKLEVDGTGDYFDVSTDLDFVSTADMVLTPSGTEIHIVGGLSVGDETEVGDNNFKVVGTSLLEGTTTFTTAGITQSAADGVHTISGIGDGNDLHIIWDYDNHTTSTTIGVSSGDANLIDWGSIGHTTTGAWTTGDVTISDATPILNYLDTDGANNDINATIDVNLVTATSGAEDATFTIQHQVDGTMRDMLANIVEGDFTLTSYKGQIILKSANTTALTIETDQDAVLVGDLTITGDDLFMLTNTTGYILRADNTNYNPVAFTASSHLAGFLSDEVGTDKVIFDTDPIFQTSVTARGATDASLAVVLEADQGADNPDTWQILIADGDELAIQAYAGGSYTDALTIVGSTLAADFPGALTAASMTIDDIVINTNALTTTNDLITLDAGTGGVRLNDMIGIDTAPDANTGIKMSRSYTTTNTAYGINISESPSLATTKAYIGAYINPNITLHDDGTHTDVHGIYIHNFTITETNTSNVTDMAALHIEDAPNYSGSDADITNGPYSIFVDAGESRFDGDIGDATNEVPGIYATDINISNDLLFDTGGIINFNAGAETITHTANALIFAGFSTGVDVDGPFTSGTIISDGLITANGAFTSPGIDDNADAIAITIDITTEEVNFTGLIDGNGTSGTSDNTLADTLIVTGQVDATTIKGATYGSDASITDAELLTLDDGETTEILVGGGAGSAPAWTTVTGTGAPVKATSPTLVTPALGAATATSVVASSNYLVEGYATGRNVIRSVRLEITPGGTPGTDISVGDISSTVYTFNAPSITDVTNLEKNETDGQWNLNATGKVLTLNLTENVVGVLSASFAIQDLNSSTAPTYFPSVVTLSNNLVISFSLEGTSADVDLTTILDAGDTCDLMISFVTSS